MRIHYETFNSRRGEDPEIVRCDAGVFANKVVSVRKGAVADKDNRVINVNESVHDWCYSVTVWYEADEVIAI